MKIPLVDLKANYQSIKSEIDTAIQKVLDNASFIMGDELKTFETSYAKFCKIKNCIGCSNGTSALYLALKHYGIEKKDEVITVPNTFIATTEAITSTGAKVRFVDVKKDTSLMDIDKLKQKITQQTKAIVVVDLYGQMPDMQQIQEIAVQNDLLLFEDACQAHGAEWNGHSPGYYSDAAVFSFFPSKNLGCYGDGGCVVTNNDLIAENIRLGLNHGRKQKYEHKVEGFNYRLDNIQAAVLNVKLKHLPVWISKRRLNASYYRSMLSDIVEHPVEDTSAKHSYHLYVIKTKHREHLMQCLESNGVSCGIHYPIPLHLQPVYKNMFHCNLPVAERLAGEIVSLPMYPELGKDQIDYIADTLKDGLGKQFYYRRYT